MIRILSFGGTPSVVPDEEIEAVFRIINSGCYSEPWRFLQVGQRVRLDSGPLRGLEGILVSEGGSFRVIASVTLLRRSVAVEVDRRSIIPAQQLSQQSIQTVDNMDVSPSI